MMIKTWTTEETRILEPIERLDMPTWMSRHRVVPNYSSKPGLWDMSLTPYLNGLMDLITLTTTEEFVLKKSAQIAGSELCHSFLMWANDQQPGDSLVVLPDQDTAEYVCKDRFEKSYKASPRLKKLFISSTLHTLTGIGQKIYFAWASSISKLASKPIKYLILDEVSKYRVNKLETKAIYNAIERTETYLDKKILILSTPNVENSEIDIFYKTSHVRYHYYVPCHKCDHYQVLRWTEQPYIDMSGNDCTSGFVKWEGGQNALQSDILNSCYVCGNCETEWTTEQKNLAVESGVWHTPDKYEGTPTKIAAHINRLYSLFPGGRFQSLVEEFIRKKKDGTIDAWKGFVNNVLAEEFKEVIEKPQKVNVHSLITDIKPQTIPSDVIALTMGVDNQKDFKYFSVWGWTKDFRGYLIDYGKVYSWEELDELSMKYYKIDCKDKQVRVWKGAIDSGGTKIAGQSMTHDVYNYVRQQKHPIFHAIKGKEMDSAIIVSKKKLESKIVLYHLNSQALLDQFYWMLGNGEIQFHRETSKEFINHLMGYQKIRDTSGRTLWERKTKRVDYTHTAIYALGIAHPQADEGIKGLERMPYVRSTIKETKVKQRKPAPKTRIINPNFR